MADTEGFPNAAFEGMVAAKPIDATDAGGTREFVPEGAAVYLVPVGTVALLASRMLALWQTPATRESM